MEIEWLGHAAFKLMTEDGKIIYLDPYNLPEGAEPADIVISSHGHFDHMDKSSIKQVTKEGTKIFGPESEAKKLKRLGGKGLKIGETLKLDEISITLVPAYTIKKGTHPKESEWAGSVLEVEGKKIYHAGDTERIPEMKDLKDITVALLPCGGKYTMDFEESCNAAADIKPNIVVPMHNWDKDLNEFAKTLAKRDPDIKVEILKNRSLKI